LPVLAVSADVVIAHIARLVTGPEDKLLPLGADSNSSSRSGRCTCSLVAMVAAAEDTPTKQEARFPHSGESTTLMESGTSLF
jgi:hypothetical protein